MSLLLRPSVRFVALSVVLAACGDSDGSGGAGGSGGSPTGGTTDIGGSGAGTSTAGAPEGGAPTGGAPIGGSPLGGSPLGGGGAETGGGGEGTGGSNIGAECRTAEECEGDLICKGPNDPQVCGIPPQEPCATNGDCQLAQICHTIVDSCSPDGYGSECRQPCNFVINDCGDGFNCDATGVCVPVQCNDGECEAWEECLPPDPNAPRYDKTDGCSRIACVADEDCPDATFCVNGYCQSGTGTCQMQEFPP